MLPLDCGAEFDPAREDEFYAAVPPQPAVFVVEARQAGAEPYLARTADLRRRLERLLRPAPDVPSKRLNLRALAARVRYRLTGSPFEQSVVHYHQARALFPQRYQAMTRLRPPALLKINLASEYPRCYVTRRIFSDPGSYFGPFPSRRAAQHFAGEFLDLFRMRRCQIRIRGDPSFPGCIYSEMKMCLAPCFAGCSKEEYDAEVGRVVRFLATGGASLAAELQGERNAASEALDYERAAAAHRRIEKVAQVLRGLPDLPRRLEELDAVVLQPAADPASIVLFPVRGGMITAPLLLRFGDPGTPCGAGLASQPRSVEEILRAHLEGPARAVEQGLFPGDLSEMLADHLSLLARWFYSRPRQGEILFPKSSRPGAGPADWPYRRIVRACSRLLAAPAAAAAPEPRQAQPSASPDAHGPAKTRHRTRITAHGEAR